jgi:hypothetical protein
VVLQLPELSGSLEWNTLHLYTTRILSVGVPGDDNANGVVEWVDNGAAENWVPASTRRRPVGSRLSPPYLGKLFFGQSSGSGAASLTAEPLPLAVPEDKSTNSVVRARQNTSIAKWETLLATTRRDATGSGKVTFISFGISF